MKTRKKPEYNMAEEVRSFNILMEEMRGHFQLAAEGLSGLREHMDKRFEEQDVKWDTRFKDLETVVRQNSRDIQYLQTDVTSLKGDVSGLKQDVSVLKQDVSVLKQDVSDIKQDVAGLHVKFDRLEEKVDRHEADIISIKAAVGI